MPEFAFRGRIPASKSILNRLLILKSFEPDIQIEGDSNADDVVKMKAALEQLQRGEPANCGAAGTTLRFLALRASRMKGVHRLTGSSRLFERPQGEIINLLSQLGRRCELKERELVIHGGGWDWAEAGVELDRTISSQFASALVLSAWNLPKPLILKMQGDAVSEGYFEMTVELVRQAGMKITRMNENSWTIPADQKPNKKRLVAESDLSSAFAVAALAAVDGQAVFEAWPTKSLQPDSVFTEILANMGCKMTLSNGELSVHKPPGNLKAIDQHLGNAPDLFPVLSILCALAEGTSRLHGAPHLVHKESDRVSKSVEIIECMGAHFERIEGGLIIHGLGEKRSEVTKSPASSYDPVHDHRLAFAAAVAKRAGLRIEIMHPEVVEKSFPEFWTVVLGVKS